MKRLSNLLKKKSEVVFKKTNKPITSLHLPSPPAISKANPNQSLKRLVLHDSNNFKWSLNPVQVTGNNCFVWLPYTGWVL